MIFVIYGALITCWLIALLRATPAWVRSLNRAGAETGRAIAWFCSGGLGCQIAQYHLDHARLDEALATRMYRRRGMVTGSTGLAQHYAGGRHTLLARQYDRQASIEAMLTDRHPARCEVCGGYRAICPRARRLDAGLPSPVGCSGERW